MSNFTSKPVVALDTLIGTTDPVRRSWASPGAISAWWEHHDRPVVQRSFARAEIFGDAVEVAALAEEGRQKGLLKAENAVEWATYFEASNCPDCRDRSRLRRYGLKGTSRHVRLIGTSDRLASRGFFFLRCRRCPSASQRPQPERSPAASSIVNRPSVTSRPTTTPPRRLPSVSNSVNPFRSDR